MGEFGWVHIMLPGYGGSAHGGARLAQCEGCRPASSSRAGAAPPARTPIAPAFLSAPPSAVKAAARGKARLNERHLPRHPFGRLGHEAVAAVARHVSQAVHSLFQQPGI